ncbi:MAG: DUF4493 domain-containing protein [Muribaculaceae bacterium]|nr:DUF4493 domain-containing protein [Muribaculaceae bacterium]
MRYYHIALLVGTLASVATGCKDETWNYEDKGTKHGTLSSRSIEYEVNAAAVVSRAASTDDFIVEITDGGSEVLDRYAYKDLPNEIDMEVGDYAVCVRTPEIYKAAWDAPYYEGTQTFTIKEDATTEVEKVICRLANVKVSVRMSDEFRRLVSDDCKLTVIANDNGELVYSLDDIDNGHAGFFEYVPTSQTLIATLDCTIEGEPVSFQTIYTDIQPGQHRIIYYDLGGGDEPVDPTPENPVDPKPEQPENPVDPTPENPVDPTPEQPTDTIPNVPVDPTPEQPTDTVPNTPVDPTPEQPADTIPENPVDTKPSGSIELGNGIVIDSSVKVEDLTVDYKTDADETQNPPADLRDPNYQAPDMPVIPGQNGTTTEPEQPQPEDPVTPVTPVDPTPEQPENPTPPVDPTPVVPDDPEPEPEITFSASQLKFDTPNHFSANLDGKVYIHADAGIKSLVLNITSTDDDFAMIGAGLSGLDFAKPDDAKELGESFNIAYGAQVKDQSDVTFDITQPMGLLESFHGTHDFEITVTDNSGNTKTVILSIVTD